jgi:hypothetical protein
MSASRSCWPNRHRLCSAGSNLVECRPRAGIEQGRQAILHVVQAEAALEPQLPGFGRGMLEASERTRNETWRVNPQRGTATGWDPHGCGS